jgi:hypothetical protein
MTKKKKKPVKSIEELTKVYEEYMKGKKPNPNLKRDFDRLITGVKPKRASQA